jgi:hypothetical protein
VSERACLIIGPSKLCGPTQIVGANCPRSPFWTVHCVSISLTDTVCLTDPFVDSGQTALVFPADQNGSLVLDEPEVIVAP